MGYGRKYTLTIQEYTSTKNEIGENVESWTDKGTIKGKMWQLNGNESYISNKDSRVVNYRTNFDKPSFNITAEDRLVYDGNNYDIEVVNDLDQRGIKLQLDLKLVK